MTSLNTTKAVFCFVTVRDDYHPSFAKGHNMKLHVSEGDVGSNYKPSVR